MPRELIILGTGVHAYEMAEIVDRINAVSDTYRLLGMISTRAEEVGKEVLGFSVLGLPGDLAKYPDAALVPDNEWPRDIPLPRERLISLVDPEAFVSSTAVMGAGCVIYPRCFVGLRAKIGDYVFCLSGTIVNHDDVIGDRTVMASGVSLAGSVTVGTDCYIGQAATVRQYTKIEDGSFIGMGAVVIRDVKAGSVVAGNPAREIKKPAAHLD